MPVRLYHVTVPSLQRALLQAAVRMRATALCNLPSSAPCRSDPSFWVDREANHVPSFWVDGACVGMGLRTHRLAHGLVCRCTCGLSAMQTRRAHCYHCDKGKCRTAGWGAHTAASMIAGPHTHRGMHEASSRWQCVRHSALRTAPVHCQEHRAHQGHCNGSTCSRTARSAALHMLCSGPAPMQHHGRKHAAR